MSITLQEYEKLFPVATVTRDGRKLTYVTPNTSCLWRVQSLFSKEPSTIEWLDSFPAGAILLDAGANVGMYSVYAAVVREARVYAFEPESQNYATLCRNIVANKLSDRVIAWSAALSDVESFDRLYLSQFQAGASCHSFGESVDPYLQEKASPFTQGCFATTIDRLVASGTVPVPNFIKIDVDGIEHKIIRGAEKTLQDPAVASLLIEINPHLAEHRWIIDHLAALGFRHDPEQVARAARTDGYFEGVGEYVFRR
ncbi:FkbM family methyltransferase [Ferrovibrio sp.]|uniref:FkbM family methyltransferase n=1 Tax=Ferrovibrio sp. TaxID=1917215 RepID=UPI00311F63C5